MRIRILLFATVLLVLQGCVVEPSLTHGFNCGKKLSQHPLTHKIVIMKSLDMRGHSGTTTVCEAFIPFVPYKRIIEEPEQVVYTSNGFKFDYENDFANLTALDLESSGIADIIVVSPDATAVTPLTTGPARPDYIIKLNINQLDWQAKYTMYCLSIVGYLPQLIGYPNSYGWAFISFSAEIYNSQGKIIATKTFSANESQNGWIYYYSGYLRALTRAYEQISPNFRKFVADTIKEK